ncbi:hypothetical protein [Brevundimonas sp.]|uniref:hypothetical protein n=1 Tax=Brevundimonas sp. TaxID=1871086 RepID=UPI002D69B5FC|nr:hypothetical protein [Brevundimonas sp.]HYC68878.1 hypothetical protein [Brevundimonas sp.]
MSPALALVLGLMLEPDPVTFRPQVSVRGDVVRLGDVADLSAVPEPLRARAVDTPVARVIGGSQSLSIRVMAARARAALPGLSPWLAIEGDGVVRITSAPIESPTAPANSPTSAPAPSVSAGDVLTLRVTVGPVTVEREVRALQAGVPGGALFVRTADGAVLRALLAEDL